MEQINGAKSIPKMSFKNQKQFSERVHRRALKAIKEISECCDAFEVKDGQTETFLFTEVNHYYWDLANVIFHLHQILIDIGKDAPTANNLQNVLDEFNKLTSSIQQSLKLEPKSLAAELQAHVVGVGFQVERLMKIIELDDSPEYKQRILDCQLDLVIYTEKLEIGMQFCDIGLAEIVKRALKLNDTVISTLMELKTKNQVVEDDFSHWVCRNVQHIRYLIDYFLQLKNSGRFAGHLNKIFNDAAKMIETFADEMLDSLKSDEPIKSLTVCMEKCYNVTTTVTNELQNGISDAVQSNMDRKVQCIAELVLYTFTWGFNCVNTLNRTMEDLIMQY